MTGTDVLRFQVEASFSLVQARIEGLSDGEWDQRAMPGTSKLGFILWHCARIVDWTVNSALQGRPEVAAGPTWRGLFPLGSFYGAGIPDALADTVPASVTRAETLVYLGEVRAALMGWLSGQTPETLDAIVNLEEHQRLTPGYLDPEVWAEVADLEGRPAWQLLARPCVSHIRVHVGEFDVLRKVLRSGAAVPAT